MNVRLRPTQATSGTRGSGLQQPTEGKVGAPLQKECAGAVPLAGRRRLPRLIEARRQHPAVQHRIRLLPLQQDAGESQRHAAALRGPGRPEVRRRWAARARPTAWSG